MKKYTLEQISQRSSVGATALKAMVKAGVNIQNHTDISKYILNKPSNVRPIKWRGGYVPEVTNRESTEESIKDLEINLQEVDVRKELKKLNELMSATQNPDSVDMLAKKISSLHKSVVTDEKLSGLVAQSEVDERERQAFAILTKFLQRLFLEMPASLVGLDVDKMTILIQSEVENTVEMIVEKLKSDE